jgi:hypothetical protein
MTTKSNRAHPRHHAGWLPALVGLQIGLAAPLHVVAANFEYLGHLPLARVLGWLALIGVALALVGAAMGIPTMRGRFRRVWACAFAALAVFSTVTAFFLPLTGTAGQIETRDIALNAPNLAIAALIALIAALACARGALRFVGTFCLLVTILSIASDSWGVLRSSSIRTVENPWRLGSGMNLLVFSLDGLARDMTLDLVDRDPALREALRDFTLFRHAASSAPSTNASIITELSGREDLKARFGDEATMFERIDKAALLHNRLATQGFSVSAYGPYGHSTTAPAREFAVPIGKVEGLDALAGALELLDYGLARTWGPAAAQASKLKSLSPRAPADSTTLEGRLAHHSGADWDAPNIRSIEDFEFYLTQLEVSGEQPAAHFMHWLFTHAPVDFDASCTYRSDDADWHAANQTYAGARAEAECALRNFARFLDRLKELGVYDDAVIALKSDHGSVTWLNDPERPESFAVRGNKMWGMSRHVPLLALKARGARAAGPRSDARAVSLSDLAVTLCGQLLAPKQCADYPGTDLFDPSASTEGTMTYNLATYPLSSYMLDEHEAVALPRGEPYEVLTAFLTDELLTGKIACGARVALDRGTPWNNGLTDGVSWVTWRDGERAFVKVAAPECAAASVEFHFPDGSSVTSDAARRQFEFPVTKAPVAVTARPPSQGAN